MRKQAQHLLHLTRNRRNAPLNLREQVLLYAERLVQALGDLVARLHERFPKLTAMQNSTLIAVGVEYQGRDYALKDGDEVSLFPPVQGG